jgi:hypothetical protein
MEPAYRIGATALVVYLIALAATTVWKLMAATTATDLVSSRKGGPVDPERVLMLVATLFGAAAYFSYGLHEGLRSGSLPEIPEGMVSAMAGGNILYLSGKIFR